MISVKAIRINAAGRFEFRVSSDGDLSTITPDPKTAVLALQHLGIRNAQALVAHAEEWGWVEIYDPE